LPSSVDGEDFHVVQRVFDGADAVPYVEVLPIFPDGKFGVRLHRMQDVIDGAEGEICFEL